MSLNPENKCAKLFEQDVDLTKITIEAMFEMQRRLQENLAFKGKALNYDEATFMARVRDIDKQWRNMTLEFAELMERLPYKEWKTYPEGVKLDFQSEEQRLEILYEYIDMFHFFMNMGLALGMDGELFKKLYATKNKENFDRQARGY